MENKYKKYPEYKDSGVEWLREIPENWKALPLKYITTCNDDVLSENTDSNLVIKYVDIGSVSLVDGIKHTVEYKFKNAPSRARRIVKDSDIIISTVRTYLKSISQIKNPPENMIVSTGFAVIRPTQHLHNGFGAYLLCSDGFVNEVINYSVGVNYPAINSSDLINIYFTLPSYKEQVYISDFLDYETSKIDTLIEKQQKLIELLKEKRQAIISHAVTKGLNPDAPMKDSGVEWLGEVPEHWEIKRLKHCVRNPLMYGANESADEFVEGDPRYVRITDVNEDGSLKHDTVRTLPIHIAENYLLNQGDVLLARSGATVGKSFIYENEWGTCCFAGYLIKASIDENIISAKWFYLYTQTIYYWTWINSSQIQATIQNVSAEKYNNFVFAVPPIEEVKLIIDYINNQSCRYTSILKNAEMQIALLTERRTSLISAAVTGKIDVRDWERPE